MLWSFHLVQIYNLRPIATWSSRQAERAQYKGSTRADPGRVFESKRKRGYIHISAQKASRVSRRCYSGGRHTRDRNSNRMQIPRRVERCPFWVRSNMAGLGQDGRAGWWYGDSSCSHFAQHLVARDEKSNQHNQACQARSCKIPQISHCRSPNLSMPAFDLPEVCLDDGLNINLGSLM